jgi:hypothetical protein
LLRNPGAPDPLQHLGGGHPGSLLRLGGRFSDESPYPAGDIRRALRTWAFSDRLRGATEPPVDLATVVRWLQTATIAVAELTRPGTGTARCRALLDRISRKQDGTAAAANTANRKRTPQRHMVDRQRICPAAP